mgnify:FL=1
MKRSSNTPQWISTKRRRNDDDERPQTEGVFVTFGLSTTARCFVPRSVVNASVIIDHVTDGEEFPIGDVGSVTPRAVKDCVDLYAMGLEEEWASEEAYWTYWRNPRRKRIITTVYRWRTRLGELLATAGFFGWTAVQNMVDCVLRQRVRSSWAAELRALLLVVQSDDAKEQALLEYFCQKLRFRQIHIEMISVWISARTISEWFWHLIERCDFRAAAAQYDFLHERLRWTFQPLPNAIPRQYDGVCVSFVVRGAVLATLGQPDNMPDNLQLFFSIVAKMWRDDVPMYPRKDFDFTQIYEVFRVAWHMPDECFEQMLGYLQRHTYRIGLYPRNRSYREHYERLIQSNRPIEIEPPSYVRERWVPLLHALGASQPEEFLNSMLRVYPRHIRYCVQAYF